MGKYEEKRKKKRSGAKTAALVLCSLILVAALAVHVMPRVLYQLSDQEETLPEEQTALAVSTEGPVATAAAESTEEKSVIPMEYPAVLEDGRLLLENMFQYEGINPDCGMESGKSIVAVTLCNTSEDYLDEANLSMELSDGRTATFCVTDMPAGHSVIAFATDNTQLEQDVACVGISCDASWSSMEVAMPEAVSVTAEEITITITNNTAQEIPALTVYCRDIFDASYFGGKTYQYTVYNLAANGTVVVEALDSIMGQTEVVRIALHE